MSFLKKISIRNKFILLCIGLMFLGAIAAIGMIEIAKTTLLQKIERDQLEHFYLLKQKVDYGLNMIKEGGDDSKVRFDDLINANSDTLFEMGIIQLAKKNAFTAEEVLNSTNFMEKALFKMAGFGEAFTVAAKDARENLEFAKALEQFSSGSISLDQLKKDYSTFTILALDNQNIFSKTLTEASSFVKNTMISLLFIALFFLFPLLFVVSQDIIKPVIEINNTAKILAEGDLTHLLEIDREDEIGTLSKSFNIMINNTAQVIKETIKSSKNLDGSSNNLSEISVQLASGTENMSSKSNMVAAAAEEMSSNMNSVAAAIEEASTNVSLVSTSAEEMTSVIDEIAKNSETGREITSKAVEQAKSASLKVDELGFAAKEIGQVTETIAEISEQTNLLALNATIEAARAGEAGKGFAVVANEIKALARQTADATTEIKKKIDGIQKSTEDTVSQIQLVSGVINDINEIVATIATAVEEQSVTTKSIAENVVQASLGIQEITENVSQSSSVAGEIAKDISDVNSTSLQIADTTSQVNNNVEELSQLSTTLAQIVKQFKV